MRTEFALLLSFLALGGISLAQSRQSQEAKIAGFIQGYDNAWNHKDAAALEHMMAPEYVYFSSKGQVRSRQSMLDELLSPKYQLAS
jgi:prophage maintenance system killer protein